MNEPKIFSSDDMESLKKVGYSTTEIEQLEAFAAPFHWQGRIHLARIFERGKLHKNSFQEIMAACQKAWEMTWKHGNPDRIGDADDVLPQLPGVANAEGYFYVYRWLGFKCPYPKFLF